MRAIAVWQGGHRTGLDDARGHAVTVDLPVDEGGEDAGTSALELSVLSLAGCISTIFALVAKRRRVRFDEMRVELDALRPEGSATITEVNGLFRILTAAPREDVETALAITLRTCPVGVLFERAHIPVRVDLEVVPPTAPAYEGTPETAPSPTA